MFLEHYVFSFWFTVASPFSTLHHLFLSSLICCAVNWRVTEITVQTIGRINAFRCERKKKISRFSKNAEQPLRGPSSSMRSPWDLSVALFITRLDPNLSRGAGRRWELLHLTAQHADEPHMAETEEMYDEADGCKQMNISSPRWHLFNDLHGGTL